MPPPRAPDSVYVPRLWLSALIALGCANPYAVPACSDGIDNDGDGVTDLDDPDCTGRSSDGEARPGSRMDAGTADGGGTDGGGRDAGSVDGGRDAGETDSGGQDAAAPDAGGRDAGGRDGGADPVLEADIVGTWRRAPGASDFGNFYLRRVGANLRAVYEHRDGRAVCDYEPATQILDCWWSQTPNRMGMNAGPCDFVISRVGVNGLHAEGTWFRQSAPGASNSGWDLDFESPAFPSGIIPIFSNDSEFRDER